MARRQKKQPGMMLYFEDYASLRASLNAEEVISVLDAMTAYAETGNLPQENTFSSAALICWRFMKPKIDRDIQNYLDICAKRSDAAKASRNSNNSSAANVASASNVASAANPTATATATATTTAAATEASAPIIGFDGTDLTQDMENCARADELVQRYKLPDTDQSREALLEDAARLGWETVENTLRRAALGNARAMLSINFYRRFFEDTGQGVKRCDSFEDYGYERF